MKVWYVFCNQLADTRRGGLRLLACAHLRPALVPCLVGEPRQGFIPSEHEKNVEYAGRCAAPGKRGAQWLGDSAQLNACFFGIFPSRGFQRRRCPIGEGGEPPGKRREMAARFWCEDA